MPPLTTPATVYLVGAGPGDPGLLTLAGADALRRASVVVYDYLANPELLNLAPASSEKIYVGKSSNQHTKTQSEINQILVDKAREHSSQPSVLSTQHAISAPPGSLDPRSASAPPIPHTSSLIPRIIVRLKGGDPYVFGRGGEEGEFLAANQIPFLEIPGITSGIAAPAYAGIPVTHRDFTTSVTLITGHEKEGADEEDNRVNFEALAKLDGTLVFYMGVKALPSIVAKLTAHGLSPSTPAAVVRWGTRANQQSVTGTLATIVDVVTAANIKAPAITIIGKVVALRSQPTDSSGGVESKTGAGILNWFESRPLFGQTILVTRTRQQASELSSQLAALGATILEAPTIELAEPDDWTSIDQILQHIPAYDWIVFTSANGVRAAWARLKSLGFDARHFGASSIAALGPATAEALEEIGITPDLLPEKFVGEELALALTQTIGKSEIAEKSFLLLRADIARPVLREELEKLGARVQDVAIYRTVPPASLPEDVLSALENNQIHLLTFTSASTAANLHALLPDHLKQKVAALPRASIGPITTQTLQKLNWPPTIEATTHTIPGLVEAIKTAKTKTPQP